jgi:hypothetical protein
MVSLPIIYVSQIYTFFNFGKQAKHFFAEKLSALLSFAKVGSIERTDLVLFGTYFLVKS